MKPEWQLEGIRQALRNAEDEELKSKEVSSERDRKTTTAILVVDCREKVEAGDGWDGITRET